MPDTPSAPGAVSAHDERLRRSVHPPEWRNPTPRGRYHLVVLGAGTGGLVTAAIGAALGGRVALVERHLMGGDCLNTGCVPSKGVIRAARAWHDARTARARFHGPAAEGAGDFSAAMERMRRIRADISEVDGAPRFAGLGVDVFLGDGRFTGPDEIEVGGARLKFRRAVIATGGRPAAPPVPGLADAGYLTSETVWDLTALPERLVVIGGGPIGCELAQSFARFGARVTLLEASDRILSRDDPDAAAIVEKALRADGVEVVTRAKIERVTAAGGEKVVRYSVPPGPSADVSATHVLVAAGRAPNTEGLGLDAAGVRHGMKGVEVDARLRTTNPRVFAVGDVNGGSQFTHAADAQARLVVRNALFFGRGKAEDLVIPWATYTSPEVAHVGLPAAEAAKRGDVDTITVPFHDVDRAKLDGEEEGFVRVHLKKGTDQIVGATIVAEHAGDLISQVTQAMSAGIGLGKIGDTIFPYPTRAEALRKAADQWRRTKLTGTAKRAFAAFFRLTG